MLFEIIVFPIHNRHDYGQFCNRDQMTSSDPSFSAPQEPRAVQSRSFPTGRTIFALILREMSTKYGRNPGGYVWALVEPLGAIIVLSFGFSLLMRAPSLGSSFLLFYATGYMPFSVYQTISTSTMRAISFSKPLLQYPAVTWLDAILARFLLNLLTGILVAYLLLSGIISFVDTGVVLDFQPIVGSMLLAAMLGLGIGALNCALSGLNPTWDIVWSIATRPLFIVSAILYIMEDMPTYVQNVLWWNPLVHITGLMRAGFFPTYQPQYISGTYVMLISLIALFVGMVLLGRYHKDILNR